MAHIYPLNRYENPEKEESVKSTKFLMAATPSAAVSMPAFGQLEEVIVTAQKREESLQDVSVSVIPVSGDYLAEQNIRRLDELSEITPSLFVAQGFLNTNIKIRGIGTEAGTNAAFEQAVVTFTRRGEIL